MIQIEEKDMRSRAFITPKRIVWTNGQVENSDVLLTRREQQISLSAHNPCIMRYWKRWCRRCGCTGITHPSYKKLTKDIFYIRGQHTSRTM